MKFGFVTCVQLGMDCIEEIYEIGGSLDLLITLTDEQAKSKSGRIYLDDFAKQHDVPLLKSRHVSDDAVGEAVAEHDLDWLFIIGWSQIARPNTLAAPKRGCIGIHPTLLPVGRGRAAVPWAILKGLPETGVTMFKLDEGVDTGPILGQERIPLTPTTTATELYDAVGLAHKALIRATWSSLVDDSIELMTQDDSQATEWPGRRPEDGEIRPEMSVVEVDRLVRAVTHPYPGAFVNGGFDGTAAGAGGYRIWSGSPEVPGDHPPLQCADGSYFPHDIEPLAEAQTEG